MGRPNKTELHSFYCIHCGNKSMELPRPRSLRRERFHRKVLYCPKCHVDVNHIEVKDEDDRFDFLDLFERGVFKDEAEESISYVRSAGIG